MIKERFNDIPGRDDTAFDRLNIAGDSFNTMADRFNGMADRFDDIGDFFNTMVDRFNGMADRFDDIIDCATVIPDPIGNPGYRIPSGMLQRAFSEGDRGRTRPPFARFCPLIHCEG